MGSRNPILVIVLNPTVVMIIAAVAVAIVVALFLFSRNKKRRHAASELGKGDQQVGQFHIHPLNTDEASRYADDWRLEQSLFREDPKAAVRRADSLAQDVMTRRGYPVSDFDENADDLAVEQPRVVENYRIAHEIALRDERGRNTSEDLYKAMVSYRELFEDLLAQPVGTAEDIRK